MYTKLEPQMEHDTMLEKVERPNIVKICLNLAVLIERWQAHLVGDKIFWEKYPEYLKKLKELSVLKPDDVDQAKKFPALINFPDRIWKRAGEICQETAHKFVKNWVDTIKNETETPKLEDSVQATLKEKLESAAVTLLGQMGLEDPAALLKKNADSLANSKALAREHLELRKAVTQICKKLGVTLNLTRISDSISDSVESENREITDNSKHEDILRAILMLQMEMEKGRRKLEQMGTDLAVLETVKDSLENRVWEKDNLISSLKNDLQEANIKNLNAPSIGSNHELFVCFNAQTKKWLGLTKIGRNRKIDRKLILSVNYIGVTDHRLAVEYETKDDAEEILRFLADPMVFSSVRDIHGYRVAKMAAWFQ